MNKAFRAMEEKQMYDNQCASPSTRCTQIDIKKSIQQEVQYTEAEIERLQEQLRVAKEKLKLIEKNKDLEAYINLLTR